MNFFQKWNLGTIVTPVARFTEEQAYFKQVYCQALSRGSLVRVLQAQGSAEPVHFKSKP